MELDSRPVLVMLLPPIQPYFNGTASTVGTFAPLSRKSAVSNPAHDVVQFSGERTKRTQSFTTRPPWLRSDGILYAISPAYRDFSDMHSLLPKEKKKRKGLKIAATTSVLAIVTFFAWAEGTAVLSPTEFYLHYVAGNGETVRVDFDELDLEGIQTSSHFPALLAMAKTLQGNPQKELRLENITFGYRLNNGDQLTIGGLNVTLNGTLTVQGNRWEFNGTLTGNPDLFDFKESAAHRSIIGNLTNWFGREVGGTEYWTEMDGEQTLRMGGNIDGTGSWTVLNE